MDYIQTVVRKGNWTDTFDGQKKQCDILIIKSNVRYGSEDDRDPVEICNDMYLNCYYIVYLEEDHGKTLSIRAEESFHSEEEAMAKAEEITKQTIGWQEVSYPFEESN